MNCRDCKYFYSEPLEYTQEVPDCYCCREKKTRSLSAKRGEMPACREGEALVQVDRSKEVKTKWIL